MIKTNGNRSFIAELLRWIAALIAVVLAARLALMLFNLVFNFWATSLGRLVSEGELAARIADASPLGIVRQLAIILIIASVVVIAQRSRRSGDGQPVADHGERP